MYYGFLTTVYSCTFLFNFYNHGMDILSDLSNANELRMVAVVQQVRVSQTQESWHRCTESSI